MNLSEQNAIIRRLKRAGIYRTAAALAKAQRRKKLAIKYSRKAKELDA